MKYLIGLAAFISGLFNFNVSKDNAIIPPLNTAIISFNETYYPPVIAEPGNFPWSKSLSVKPVVASVPKPIAVPEPVAPPPTPAIPEDPYIPRIDPISPWLKMDFSFVGNGESGNREIPSLDFDREYWKIEIFAYWASDITSIKPPVEKDYFKMEVYESGTNKLVTTIGSGGEAGFYKNQYFRKPGKYYFKIINHAQSRYEVNFFVSPKLAQ